MSAPWDRESPVGVADTDDDRPPTRAGGGTVVLVLTAIVGVFLYAEPWRRPFVLLGALSICILLHIGAISVVASMMGTAWTSFQLFQGNALIRCKWRDRWFVLGWIPLGGSVRLRGMDEGSGARLGTYAALPPLYKIAIQLVGPTVLLVSAAVLLGPSEASTSVFRGPRVLISAVTQVVVDDSGTPALAGFVWLLDHGSVFRVIGVVAAQMAWLNLLPLPLMNGGLAIGVLLREMGVRMPRAAVDIASLATVLLCVGGVFAFSVALAHAW